VRYGFAQTATHFYVFGGVSNGTRVNSVNRLVLATGMWESRAAMPFTSEAPTCALMASTGLVYCTEGDTGSGFASYNIATNVWTPLANIPGGDHYGAASGAFNGKVFVAGGGSGGASNTVQVYDVAMNTWSAGTVSPNTFLLAGYQQVGQFLYVIGGYAVGLGILCVVASFRLPLELRLLVRRRVAPWTVSDALLGMRVFALTLSQNWEGEIVRARLAAKLGAARLEQLEPGYPVDGFTSLPAGAAEAVRAALELRARAGGVEGAGSNNWVLSADRTTTGAPLLANDPHLGVSLPGIWMQMGLHCREVTEDCPLDVSGFTFSGVPGVIIGHNADIAWGFTNLGPDVIDLYLEKLDTAGTQVTTIERCAGHDGTWGVKEEYYENSMKIGRPVFRQMAEGAPDYVSSDCAIAGRHIRQGMGESPGQKQHPITLIRIAYGL